MHVRYWGKNIFLCCLESGVVKGNTTCLPDWKVCILHGQVEMAKVRLHRKFSVEKAENNRLKQ